MPKYFNRALALSVLILVAGAYWSVLQANFVWDDWLDFHDMPWLRQGDLWQHFIFRDFNYWTNYFRPLVVALFTLQVRLFDGLPGPMHAVSLCMHLINTILVGMLAKHCHKAMADGKGSSPLIAIPMLAYGMHPALIEPVAWIGCQFEMVVTMMVLLGLLANLTIRKTAARAVVVAALFFLAACAKESALSFPLLVVIFDWIVLSRQQARSFQATVYSMLARNWLVYVAIFVAGLAYLAFRHWALGSVVNPFNHASTTLTARLQEVCFIYVEYWKSLFLPMSGMSPVHPAPGLSFQLISVHSLVTDVIAASIITLGLALMFKYASAVGYIIVCITATLLPVLHIVPVNFDSSLYHERYVMTGLAVACALIPLLQMPSLKSDAMDRISGPLKLIVAFSWVAFAFVSIQTTVPRWANNTTLWQWALVENPDSVEAKDGLLSAYVNGNDYARANALIDRLLADKVPCVNCMLNAAVLAVAQNDPARAAVALEKIRDSRELGSDKEMFRVYLLTTGQMLAEQGDLAEATKLLRAAVEVDVLRPQPKIALAMALFEQGHRREAKIWWEAGIALLPAAEQALPQKLLDKAMATDIQSNEKPAHLDSQ